MFIDPRNKSFRKLRRSASARFIGLARRVIRPAVLRLGNAPVIQRQRALACFSSVALASRRDGIAPLPRKVSLKLRADLLLILNRKTTNPFHQQPVIEREEFQAHDTRHV